jgi:hypothetical protein
MLALTITLSLLAALVVVSLYEYIGHRSILHAGKLSFGRDHLTHHKYFARDFRATGEQVAFYDQYWVRGGLGLVWPLPLAVPVALWVSWIPAAILLATACAHGLFWQWCHNEMHRPATGWLQRSRYFRFICNFHLGHHQKSRTNYAFCFAPIWDTICGTYRRTDPPLDHGGPPPPPPPTATEPEAVTPPRE